MKRTLLFLLCAASAYSFTHTFQPIVLKSKSHAFQVSRIRASAAAQPPVSQPASALARTDAAASRFASALNVAKNIVGGGMLALPAGLAGAGGGVIPAVALVLGMGKLNSYTFGLVGKCCHAQNATSFKELWTINFGPDSEWMIHSAVFFKCFLALVMYSVIIGDVFSSVAATLQGPALLASRHFNILGLTLVALLPLCLLRNLSQLSKFSLAGNAAALYSILFIASRKLDGSYGLGGRYSMLDATAPLAFANPWAINTGTLLLISMLSTAYMAHYNAPQFYKELRQPTPQRFQSVAGWSFGFSALSYTAVMLLGFYTFGAAAQGNILNNYSVLDRGACLARLATGVSILLAYPLTFLGMREAGLKLAALRFPRFGNPDSSVVHVGSTTTLLAAITAIALTVTNLGFVVSFNGAVLGSLVCYMLPALLFLKAHKLGHMGPQQGQGDRGAIVSAKATVALGLVLAVLGGVVSVLSAFTNVLGGAVSAH